MAAALLGAPALAREPAIVITNARVFDGTGAPAAVAEVRVEGERIVAVGKRVPARGAKRIDGRGMTLIPGLHDLHTHLRAPAYDGAEDMQKAWAGYLLAGVTSVNDYSLSGEMIAPVRALAASPGPVRAPHLVLAVRLGVPGGHGTEYGWGDAFTLEATTARAGTAAAARALAYVPDALKVFADGWRYGRAPDLASMNRETLAAIASAAHARAVPVFTHTVTLGGARLAALAGVDALGHGVGDAPVDAALIAAMKAGGTAYVPTMVVYEPQEDRQFTPAERAMMSAPERLAEDWAKRRVPLPIPDYEARRWRMLEANLRTLHDAGVRIGVGTDAGIGGVYHGPATLREIGILARLELGPAGALAAATNGSAAILKDPRHGRIAPGQRADLVLVAGRPDEAIADLWQVRRVWVAGREADLPALRKVVDGPGPTPLAAIPMPGPIDTGARADGRTDLDTLPVESTDPGADHSDIVVAGPNPPARFITARLGGAPRPYAALVYPLTRGAILPADASRFTGIRFVARGAGDYWLSLDAYGQEGRFAATFSAGAVGREVRLPFSAFAGQDGAALDTKALRSLAFTLSGEPGSTAWLELADVRFY